MKIAVVKKISQSFLKKCIKNRVDTIIYCYIADGIDYETLEKKFKLINASDELEKGIWFNFQLVSTQLEALKKKFHSLFNFKKIDLEEGLKKDLFWSFFQDYGLLYHAEKLKNAGNEVSFYSKRNYFIKKASLIKNLFFDTTAFYKSDVKKFDEKRTKQVAFRINSKATPSIYGNLLNVLGQENIISFQSKSSNQKTQFVNYLNSVFNENIGVSIVRKEISIPFFIKIRLLFLSFETEFLIGFLKSYKKLCNHIDEYEKLFKSGINKIVFNAGENEGETIIACSLAKKYNAKIFNYMNGAKPRSPQNINTFFDYWFMPDKKTQESVLSYCNVSENQAPVTGHLLKELAQNHTYSGTLNKYLKNIEQKKIIALFTSPLFANEIKNVLNFLVSYIDKRSDIVVLIRKHPSETQAHNFSHNNIIEMKKYSAELSQISLFDLLLKSDAAISFSSTVSWQASWFGIPSINYEVSEKSRLLFVDDERIIHINNIEKLEKYLDKYLYTTGLKNKRRKEENNASYKIASIILNS